MAWAGDSEALALLQRLATSDPRYSGESQDLRVSAVQAIAQWWAGDDGAFAFLQSLVTPDPESDAWRHENRIIREKTVQALGQYWASNPSARFFLQDLFANHPDPQTRIFAFRALVLPLYGLIISPGAAEEQAARQALAALRDGFGHQDHAIREAAILLSSQLANGIAFPGPQADAETLDVMTLMEDRAAHDPETRIRVIALESLAWCMHSSPPAFTVSEHMPSFVAQHEDFLREVASGHPDATGRATAIWALADGCPHDDRLLAFLRDLAKNDLNSWVRVNALRAIGFGWAGNPEALGFLRLRVSRDPEPEVCAVISQVLFELADSRRVRHRPSGGSRVLYLGRWS
jgi:HEAT repeats